MAITFEPEMLENQSNAQDLGFCLVSNKNLSKILPSSTTVHNLQPSIMNLWPSMCNLKYKIWWLCWYILKQNKRKKSRWCLLC